MHALEEKKKPRGIEGVWVGESSWKAFDPFPDGGWSGGITFLSLEDSCGAVTPGTTGIVLYPLENPRCSEVRIQRWTNSHLQTSFM